MVKSPKKKPAIHRAGSIKSRPQKSKNKSLKKSIYTKPVLGLSDYFKNERRTKKKTSSKSKVIPFQKRKTVRHTPRYKIAGIAPIRFWKNHPRVFYSFLTVTVTFSGMLYFFVLKDLPDPREITNSKPPMTTIIRDRNGLVLYRVYNSANRVQLNYDEMPETVKQATIAIEDAGFYNHFGIDLKAILRAFLNNINQGDIDLYQGGSTITQQLVKNRFFTPVKSYQRKIKEIVMSLWLERIYSKEEILTQYLNTVGYGGPAYGIEAASQMYFDKSVKDLTLSEAAFLAGLPAAPTTFSPYGTNPQLADLRKQQVLERMFKLDFINEDQYFTAINRNITLAPQKINILAPHFVMYVKNELVNKFGEKAVEEGGMDVTTTLDLNIQRKSEEIVRKNIYQIKDRYKIGNAAVLVTDTDSGEILSMVGSVDYFDTENDGHFNAVLAKRQPGSAIKPVNYAYAFDHGFTPASTVTDAPVVYKSSGSKEIYAPVNYDGKFHGNVTLRSALANSYNIPAVKILEKIGVANMIKQGIDMGIDSWNNISPVGLSLTLGGAEVTMLDMARAYGTIANQGNKVELKSILAIRDSNSEDLTAEFYNNNNLSLVAKVEASSDGDDSTKILGQTTGQIISPLSAYWLIDILSDNLARLPAFGTYSKLSVPNHKIAVKTGTSNNFRDNWTIGFSPDYLVSAWVGNNDGSFMNKNLVSGITGAAPIWNEVMTGLLEDVEPKNFPAPTGLIPVKVCAVNGLLTCPNCPQEKTEYFTVDKVPTKTCFFRPPHECEEAKKLSEGKSDEEKKQLLANCPLTN